VLSVLPGHMLHGPLVSGDEMSYFRYA
jgi:hypothetical protein